MQTLNRCRKYRLSEGYIERSAADRLSPQQLYIARHTGLQSLVTRVNLWETVMCAVTL